MKSLKGSKKLAKKEALLFSSRNALKTNNPNLYKLCQINGWLNYVCSHMTPTLAVYNNPRIKWYYNTCKKEAKKHHNRVLFKKNARGCYDVCERNGWLPEFCKHMKSPMVMREKNLQNKLYKSLRKRHPNVMIELEYILLINSKKTGRIDFLLTHTLTKKSIAFELKHSASKWTKNELIVQKKNYNKAFKSKSKFKGVHFICDTNKYGVPVDNIDRLIKRIY